MTVDRPAILRNAERLVRLGKLGQAVEEYLRALTDDPRDWAVATVVGELYVQLGETERGVERLVQAADGLREDGLLSEAAVLYERVLALGTPSPVAAPGVANSDAQDLDDVFAGLRREVAEASAEPYADAQLAGGEALLAAGRVVEGLAALEGAARSPRVRFQAASRLAQMYRQRGEPHKAVEWFARAAEAPAPAPEAGHALLYDLADTLESLGEDARALATFMELQIDAGDYRDVSARLGRLTARARG